MIKKCTSCKIEKATSEFSKDKTRSDGLQCICKSCRKEYSYNSRQKNKEFYNKKSREYYSKNKDKILKRTSKWRVLNSEKMKNAKLKHKYNITLDEYNKMLEKQNGVCAICFQEEKAKHQSGTLKGLSVDHCHKTGKVRGLLCADCNTSIGKFKEDYNIIQRAAMYVQKKGEI